MNADDREDRVSETRGQSKYNKGGTAGIEGVLFQVDLLAVVLLNAFQNFKGWKLSTENKRYGKFDDIVLELPDGPVLLQAKHRKNRKILFNELFSVNSKNNDFSLGKYFFSYHETKDQIQVKHVIICTNSEVKDDDGMMEKFLNRQNITNDSVLYYSSDYSFYTFNESILPKLEEHVRSYYIRNLKGKNVDEGVITLKNLSDFLNHLQLYSSYPSEQKLSRIIEQLISNVECARDLVCETSSKYIHNKMLDWFRQPQGIHLEDYHVQAMICEMRSSKYCEILEKYNVFFNNAKFVFRDTERILHVVSKGWNLLSVLKIYRALQSNNKTMANILYVSSDDSAYIQYFIEAFDLPQYTHLIIISPELERGEIKKITLKLRETLNRKPYKTVILVANSNNRLASDISLNNDLYNTIEERITFKSLSTDTQFRLLKNKNICFQGKYISLEELISVQMVETCERVLDTETMEKLIKSERVKVGSLVQSRDEHIEKYYVHRKFVRKISSADYGNKEEIIDEENICDLEDKLILIVDSAGAGKSTVFTHLAITIKEQNPQLWVLKVNLNDYTTVLKKLQVKNRNTMDIMDLLESIDGIKLKSRFEGSIFSTEQRVLLMLDGVDEVCPDYLELILNLISQCQKTSNFYRILVTTRSNTSQKLEEKLNVKPFQLQPFTTQNQIDFLTNFWMQSFEAEEEKRKKCEHYAKALINKMEDWTLYWIRHIDSSFTAVPLHVRMLAEIFETTDQMQQPGIWIGCKEYLDADDGEPEFTEKMNIVQLYKMFIMKKRDIFVHKGNPTGTIVANLALNKEFEESLVYHRAFALEVILGDFYCKYFSCFQYVDKNSMDTNILKIGIIQLTGNSLHFMHRTFAEYFVAETFFMDLMEQRTNPNRKFQMIFIDHILALDKHNVVRTFLDSFLQNISNPLPSDIFRNSRFFKYRINLYDRFYNQYLLHRLAEDGCVEILRFLFKCIGFSSTTSKMKLKFENLKYPLVDRNLFSVETLNCLKYLTDRGGVNLLDWKDETPLQYAVQRNHFIMVQFLLEHGANVDCRDKFGNTVLWIALLAENVDIIEILIRNGADVNVRNNSNATMIHFTVIYKLWPIFKILVENGADVDAVDRYGFAVLHILVIKSHLEHVKYLVQYLADVNVRNFDGVTPLQLAAFNNQLETVKFLVECGADVNSVDSGGWTALHVASVMDYDEIVKFLIEKCEANVIIKDHHGCLALNLAIACYSRSVEQLLLNTGANRNVEARDGEEIETDIYHILTLFNNIYFKTPKTLYF